jgi:integrase
MRWSEQFSLTWSQVDFRRKLVFCVTTKNPKARKVRRLDVPLNSVSIAALQDQKRIDGKATGPKAMVFPRPGPSSDWDW